MWEVSPSPLYGIETAALEAPADDPVYLGDSRALRPQRGCFPRDDRDTLEASVATSQYEPMQRSKRIQGVIEAGTQERYVLKSVVGGTQ